MQLPIINTAQPINWANPLNRGLISRWQNMPYGVGGGGTIFRDLVLGSAYHGTLTAMAAPSTTNSGWNKTTRINGFGHLSFDSNDDQVVIGNQTPLQLSKGSLLVWLNTSSLGTVYRGIVVKKDAYGIFGKADVLMIFDWGASADRSTGLSLANSLRWWRIGLSFDSGVTNGTVIYLNGAPVLTTTMTVSNQLSNLLIGHGGSANQFMFGNLDDVRVYDRLLSGAEFSQDYLNAKMPKDPTLNWISRTVYSFPTTVRLDSLLLLGAS